MNHREVLIEYLKSKVEVCDWHAVSDAANDLRVLEARQETKASPAAYKNPDLLDEIPARAAARPVPDWVRQAEPAPQPAEPQSTDPGDYKLKCSVLGPEAPGDIRAPGRAVAGNRRPPGPREQ